MDRPTGSLVVSFIRVRIRVVIRTFDIQLLSVKLWYTDCYLIIFKGNQKLDDHPEWVHDVMLQEDRAAMPFDMLLTMLKVNNI